MKEIYDRPDALKEFLKDGNADLKGACRGGRGHWQKWIQVKSLHCWNCTNSCVTRNGTHWNYYEGRAVRFGTVGEPEEFNRYNIKPISSLLAISRSVTCVIILMGVTGRGNGLI